MWVDVVEMRQDGVKLAPDVVMVRRPTRGWLIVRPIDRRISQDGQRVASTEAVLQVTDGLGGPTALPGIYNVRVRRWEGSHLILLGEQYVLSSGVPGRFWPQAWWVRLLPSRDAPPSMRGSPHPKAGAAPCQ